MLSVSECVFLCAECYKSHFLEKRVRKTRRRKIQYQFQIYSSLSEGDEQKKRRKRNERKVTIENKQKLNVHEK